MTYNALGDPECGRQDLVLMGKREKPREADGAAWLEFLFAVVTNAAFLVPLRMLWRRRRVADVGSCVRGPATKIELLRRGHRRDS